MLTGKNALVTGASRGIGRQIALTLAAAHAFVIVNYNGSKEKADAVVAEIKAAGGDAVSYQCNVSDFDECQNMITALIKEYKHIDILVNNAGITRDGLIMKMSEADYDAVLDTNLKGAFNTIRHMSRYFLKQKSGRIINISSVAGTTPDISRLAYGVSKAAINSLTKQTAVEYARDKIRANAVLPGFVGTDGALQNMSKSFLDGFLKHVPLNEVVKPVDIANMVAFLASDKARYVTGELITVAGGFGLPTPIYGNAMSGNIKQG